MRYKYRRSTKSGERGFYLGLLWLTVSLEHIESVVDELCLSKFVTVFSEVQLWISIYNMLKSLFAIFE